MTATTMNAAAAAGTRAAGRNYRVGFFVGLFLIVLLATVLVADRIFNPAEFRITDVEVRGNLSRVSGEDVVAAARETLDGNYFSSDLEGLETRIEQIPWVYSATIRRKWPSTLAVNVQEIEPVARWGSDRWLNFTGDVVPRQGVAGSALEKSLPRLNGPEEEIGRIRDMFGLWSGKFATAGLVLAGVNLNPLGLWELELELGALARSRLPAEVSETAEFDLPVRMIADGRDPTRRIDRFIRAINQHLIDKFPFMASVDLRYPNGFAIGWKDGQPVVPVIQE